MACRKLLTYTTQFLMRSLNLFLFKSAAASIPFPKETHRETGPASRRGVNFPEKLRRLIFGNDFNEAFMTALPCLDALYKVVCDVFLGVSELFSLFYVFVFKQKGD